MMLLALQREDHKNRRALIKCRLEEMHSILPDFVILAIQLANING